MRALTRKMLRDIRNVRGQALAICLVMACGVATFVTSLSTLHSLQAALDAYYERYRFAHVFAHMERAPRELAGRMALLPGVVAAQARVVKQVTLDMPGLSEPAVGRLISAGAGGAAQLNRLHLRAGRPLEPGARGEVLVSEGFADAHGLRPGDSVRAIINGRFQALRVVGVALSPEHIYLIREGDVIPDERRYGVFWMDDAEIAAAFDMTGAFNDVALLLGPGASEAEVIRRLDGLIERFGGLGAYGRREQVSHQYISNEIKELRAMTAILPVIFLVVAAMLLNIVFSRLIATQREVIATLKAVGYSRAELALHYVQMALLIALAGGALGVAAGAWMGSGLTRMYAWFFHFPSFEYQLRPSVAGLAVVVAALAAALGALGAARRAARMPPAEAMRPEPPGDFRPTLLERLGFQRLLSPAARMILRQIERRPGRAVLSVLGIALAASILVVGNSMKDAIDVGIDFQFHTLQRHDLSVGFIEPAEPGVLSAMRHLPGVRQVEPVRGVFTRMRAGHRERRIAVTGLDPEGELFNLLDMNGRRVRLPPEGVVLSRKLGEILGVQAGDAVTLELLEGSRAVRRVPVAGLIDDFLGLSAYMHIEAANRLMREGAMATGALVAADPVALDELYRALKAAPHVGGVTVRRAALSSFYETMARTLLRMRAFNVGFAVIIAVGVVYSTARISLAERSRELATLRVIGFTRGEIGLIQLGEQALLTGVGIPLGLALGFGLAALMTLAFDMELVRIPLAVNRATYAFAAAVILVASLASGVFVRRMLNRLDLVAVLKARD
jgi:putative ABC transport system permease protein